ncbi:H-2 class I histocompatibility antigen, alpha chain-like isoform X2 [Phocoena sinus]|uniref:H-2 class I histocompatibility antigen, alpha chain-like isoform X2 n=1 Tax=Phocoena sinus TaxID=42100 RepID=UPI0013C4E3C8|nr:H-2 class I histocompatibility antigen, alpha chain-like isoform X2 [Phocoena sinus]
MTPMDAQYWETETRKQEKWAEVQQVEMWTVMGYHNHSSGMHSAQRMFGCEIQEDGRYRGFWQFGYDGQDHLSLDLETLSWVSAEPVAMRTKHWWETERCYAEYDKAYLEGPCLASLHRYLELGGQRFSRREPPTVRITEHSAKDGGTILRCWALGFYPHNILLSWWLGEKELDSEYAETRPSGDGTYQTWAAAWVPAGKKAQYTCRVQHSSLNHTFTVSWESSHPGLTAMVISLVLVLLVVVGGVTLTKCIQARNKESYEQAPGDCGMDRLGREVPGVLKHGGDALEFRMGAGHGVGAFPGLSLLPYPTILEPGSPPSFLPAGGEDPHNSQSPARAGATPLIC